MTAVDCDQDVLLIKVEQSGVSRLVSGLAGLMGAEAGASLGNIAGVGPLVGGGIGGLGALLISMYGLHSMGLSVKIVEHLSPLVADQARRLAQTSTVAPVGAAIGKTVNEVGSRT